MDVYLALTKLEAARRQIEAALGLWFHDGDPVSIHTLAAAAHRVVGDIGEVSGKGAVLTDRKQLELQGWNPKVMKKAIRTAETFFKHADTDPHDTYTFDTVSTQYILYSTIECYQRLVQDKSELMSIFMLWIHFRFPKTLTQVARHHFRDLIARSSELTPSEFFQEYKHLGSQITDLLP